MPIDFSQFDVRNYPVVDVEQGYDQWAASYEDVVQDDMDIRLLRRITSVQWSSATRVIDLACGTGRIGAWLVQQGVQDVSGIDISGRMLELARARGVYSTLRQGDVTRTLPVDAGFDLCVMSLADEHLPDLAPLYSEASRLLCANGFMVLVGYHPQFLMTRGMPTHFHRADGQAVAIQTHVHLLSDHVSCAAKNGLALLEMHEGLIDEEYVAAKPKWRQFLNTPVSFAFVWCRSSRSRA